MLSFGKKKKSEIDLEQHELLENAHKRIKQKKRVFTHFVGTPATRATGRSSKKAHRRNSKGNRDGLSTF